MQYTSTSVLGTQCLFFEFKLLDSSKVITNLKGKVKELEEQLQEREVSGHMTQWRELMFKGNLYSCNKLTVKCWK